MVRMARCVMLLFKVWEAFASLCSCALTEKAKEVATEPVAECS